MKTLLTLEYPVFIIVTNSNSKVHPFTERTDGKPLVQESCENVTHDIVAKKTLHATVSKRCFTFVLVLKCELLFFLLKISS